MTTEIIGGIRVLRPAEGKKVKHKNKDIYSSEVWLGCHDSPENYMDEVEPEKEKKLKKSSNQKKR